jgi:lysophospholipase
MDDALARRATPPSGSVEFWKAADGWPLAVGVWREGARGTLLFLNGRADFLGKYAEALWRWRGRGWAVCAPDWRGQGLSGRLGRTPLHGHVATFDPWLDDLSLVVARLAAWPQPLVAVGHSMGGHLLLRGLARGLPSVARAALAAPMCGIAAPVPRELVAALARAAVGVGFERRFAPGQRMKLDATAETRRAAALTSCPRRQADERWWLDRHPERALGGVTWGWLDAAFDSIRRLGRPGAIEGVRQPVLALLAADERVVDNDAATRMLARLPNGRHVRVEGRHELLREADRPREAVMRTLDRFLEDGRFGG